MKTNREWLNELAANDVDALQAWFDAEHFECPSETQSITPSLSQLFGILSDDGSEQADSNNVDISASIHDDTRTQIIADVNAWIESVVGFSIWASDLREHVVGWLDRQAAITAHANTELINNQAKAVMELQRQVDELTDSYEASSRANEILTLENGRVKTENAKLQAQVDELTQKLDNLAHDLKESERFREELREELSVAYDHAHDLLARRDRGLA